MVTDKASKHTKTRFFLIVDNIAQIEFVAQHIGAWNWCGQTVIRNHYKVTGFGYSDPYLWVFDQIMKTSLSVKKYAPLATSEGRS